MTMRGLVEDVRRQVYEAMRKAFMVDEGQDTPDLIVIDAKPKQSASKA